MDGESERRAVRGLRRTTARIAAAGILVLAAGAFLLAVQIPVDAARRGFALASTGWIAFSALLWLHSDKNRVSGGRVLSGFGPANLLTIARGLLMASFAGLLAVPRLEGLYAWLPGLLYTAAALPDYVDGLIARRTGRTTRLGEILDMEVDSAGVFVATALAVRDGIVPGWYLAIGLARYLFVFGLWLRARLGRRVHDLPPSVRRRGFAALKMGFMFAVLLPVFGPPATHLVAAALGLPFALGFLWDWGLATGRIRPGKGSLDSPGVRFSLAWLPVALRLLAVVLGAAVVGGHLGRPETYALSLVEIAALALIAMGIVTRPAAIAAAVLLGLSQNFVPLGPAGSGLLSALIGLVMLGAGRFALFPLDDRLVFRRTGDPG
ncbi:MAG TPA: CDP-alcohol phosphatidyltransferase family protein [Anaerolineales bacterium]|nr:CDP-alcohol phosphatidyltransferase family protein [Anaerolineales bacterium]